jgi:hypothetical protein
MRSIGPHGRDDRAYDPEQSADATCRRACLHSRTATRRPSGAPRGRVRAGVVTDETGLTPDVLLLGALYALEQCGLLLTDAVALLEQRRYPTAASIALLAHEELGRHKILLDCWRQSAGGRPLTQGEVNKACDDHVEAKAGWHLRRQSVGDAPHCLD